MGRMTEAQAYAVGDLVEVRLVENGTPGSFVGVVMPERGDMPGELVVQVLQSRGAGPVVAPRRHPGLIEIVQVTRTVGG